MLIDIYKYKIGAKELLLKEHNVNDILGRLSDKFSTKAAERSISLQIRMTEHSTINCDATELEVLIGHLVENAVKHARSQVVVSGRLQPRSFELRIRDDGCGIAEADISSLFDRFYVSSSDGKFSAATGTGLFLCAEIAKAHGGSIECQSTVGQGSCFTVTLPTGS
jgi:signal transduction histidine kinase